MSAELALPSIVLTVVAVIGTVDIFDGLASSS